MKKVLMLSMVLLSALVAQAQLKVFPTLKKGFAKTYVTTNTFDIPMQGTVVLTDETTYTVSETTADGYVIDMLTTTITSDIPEGSIAGQILAASMEIAKGINIKLSTDKNGSVTAIKNYAEVQKTLDTRCDEMVEKLNKLIPQLSTVFNKEALKQQLMENLAEQRLLASIKNDHGPLSLFGKTIMTGAQETFVNQQGLQLKRMYFVSGKNVTTSESLDMNKEDIKKLIIAQIEKMAPAQADMVKENIDQLMESGMLKMDVKSTATYEFDDNCWVKAIQSEATTETAGQATTTKSKVVCK